MVLFKREMLEQVHQLRVKMGTTHRNPGPHVFSSEDNVVKCTGIMTFVLSDRSMLPRLRGMNLAHIKVLEAQDDLKPLELAYVACKSSYDAQMKALVGTRYLVEKWRV